MECYKCRIAALCKLSRRADTACFKSSRGTLFFHIARIIKAKRPSAFLLENVPGLLSHGEGKTYKTILETFSDLGYCMEWCVLNSADHQIPQSRKRVFIVGYLDLRCAGKIFPLESGRGKDPQKLIDGSQGQRIYSTDGAAVTQCAGSGGWGGKTGLYFIDMNPDPKLTENARCITARQDSGISNHKGEHSGVLVEEPRAIINPEKEKTRQNGRRVKEPNEPMFTLTVQDRHKAHYQRKSGDRRRKTRG